MNEAQQLAQKILDQITMYPKRHNQRNWAAFNECGTTFCIAGWATELTVGTEVYVNRNYETCILPKGDKDFSEVGMEVLELTHDDAQKLFYRTTNEQAVMALKYLANGERIDWKEIHNVNHI